MKSTTHSCSKRHGSFSTRTSQILKGLMLVSLLSYQGATNARVTYCDGPEDYPDYPPATIDEFENDTYECDIFEITDTTVEATGVSFISVNEVTQTYIGSGYINLGSGFRVIEGASFSATFVPDVKYFSCGGGGSCHGSW